MPATLTLFELNALVRKTIEHTLDSEYWVEAELSECRESRGHCYMELVEKGPDNATPIARASAKCWRTQWLVLRPMFERTTGQTLHAGLKVRLKVYAQFHEAYGFSWIVTGIDPTFTLGDMARRRQEIIRQLKEEGIFDLQKELQLPLFCQRIAVISSATAAGYGDFCKQLGESRFAFSPTLFPATMQGEQVEQSIIHALEQIYEAYEANEANEAHEPHAPLAPSPPFDCVVIIRGGGGTSDLSGFDTLALAEHVAQFPLPVITGIGHDRDESILDMVSHTRVKTPTAAAALLIDHLKLLWDAIGEAETTIVASTQQRMTVEQLRLSRLSEALPRLFSVVRSRQEQLIDQLYSRITAHIGQRIVGQQARLDALQQRLPLIMERRLNAERHRLELLSEQVKSLDPQLLLRRGYSITLHQGKAVHDATTLSKGDTIETRLEKGNIKSIIT